MKMALVQVLAPCAHKFSLISYCNTKHTAHGAQYKAIEPLLGFANPLEVK
jgi:hypothetical protein